MEEEILKLLEKHSYEEKELKEILKNDVNEEIKHLLSCGKILLQKNKLILPKKINAFKAKIISVKDFFAFAKTENDEDCYISKDDLHGALLDDEVFLKKVNGRSKLSYEVISIIKRNKLNVVGEVKNIKGLLILDVKGISIKNHDFIIKNSTVEILPHQIVLAHIIKWQENFTFVEVYEVLGYKNDPGIDILKIVYEHDADVKFSEQTLEEVKHLPLEVQKEDLKNRTSFLDHVIVTIDGEDAKDFDDAVEVKKDAKGYHVGVHIADVSFYVKEGTFLDKDARNRSTSIYCVNKVIPMLPIELSNGICSLNPHVLRLVQSVLFDMDLNGNIVSYSLHKGYIKSSARLTYSYVNQVLKEHKIDNLLPKEVNEMLPILNEVATLIRKRREKEGCLELSSTELVFEINKEQGIENVYKRKQDVGEKLIEDLMIEANELVAKKAQELAMPFIYRIHEYPKIKRMQEFIHLSKVLNYPCDFDAFNINPKILQKHIKQVKEDKNKEILSYYLLRALAKARYSNTNKGHFGLALQNYTHFTSPIRRYPDLIVHRILDSYVFNIQEKYNKKELDKELLYLSELTSTKERNAQNIEREVDDLYAAKYMSQFIGQTFIAKVVSLNASQIYVELENGIEGMIPCDFLNERFYYDENNYTLIFHNHIVKLGDEIKVLLEATHIDEGQIIFSLPLIKKSHTIKKESKKSGRKNKKYKHK